MKTAQDQKQIRRPGVRGDRGTTHLGIRDHANGLFQFGILVDEYVAETVRVTHYGDAGVVLDVSYESVASPWDHQVDVFIQGKQG